MTRTSLKAGGQRIDYSEAEQLLRTGKTQTEVADLFGVTQAAVAGAIRRGRIKVQYDRVDSDKSGIPWSPIRPEHRQKYLARMLRAAARRADGRGNAPVIEAQLDLFLKRLNELDAVVHYDPDTEEGFFRVPRRHGIDKGLIREPHLDDDGNEI